MRSVKKSSKRKSNPKSSKKIGIFGGTFDPFHAGHKNSLKTVLRALKFDHIRVIPTYQSPLRKPIQGASPAQRLKMVELGLKDAGIKFVVDPIEIERKGTSYTIETLAALKDSLKGAQLSLIIGVDQLEHFDKWKDFETILQLTDLVVTSRPGVELPDSVKELPRGLQPLIKSFTKKKIVLRSGKTIQFLPLTDVDVSASEIRRRIRNDQPLSGLVDAEIAEYIAQEDLYGTVSKSIGDFEKFTSYCMKFLDGKGAVNLQAFDLRRLGAPAEFTIVTSGTSTRHTSALAESLIRDIKTQYHILPQGVEGLNEGRWVVVDYGSLMIHVFYDFVRQEYRLEELWKDGVRL